MLASLRSLTGLSKDEDGLAAGTESITLSISFGWWKVLTLSVEQFPVQDVLTSLREGLDCMCQNVGNALKQITAMIEELRVIEPNISMHTLTWNIHIPNNVKLKWEETHTDRVETQQIIHIIYNGKK